MQVSALHEGLWFAPDAFPYEFTPYPAAFLSYHKKNYIYKNISFFLQ